MDIKKLFEKFVNNTLSEEEYETFMRLFADPDYQHRIKGLMDDYWTGVSLADNTVANEADENQKRRFEKIEEHIRKAEVVKKGPGKEDRRFKIGSSFVYKAAAVVVLLMAPLFLLKQRLDPAELSVTKGKQHNAVTLKLDDGRVEVISAEDEQNVVDPDGNVIGTQKGRRIIYDSSITAPSKLAYNELTVPYGNQFDLILSDGTQIKLNAGSWLRYPIHFVVGNPRQVFLKGEAYFDVAEDEGRPFVVNANAISVEVLGTKFNLSFYPEDSEISTVLVEGAVKMYQEGDKKEERANLVFLNPGQKASWHKQDKTMQVTDTDVELYTAWKDGVLLFRRTPFGIILKKLERHFDIAIQNNNTYLEDQVYTASFKGEGIYEILDAFQEDTPFEYSYDAENNTITLTEDLSKTNAYE